MNLPTNLAVIGSGQDARATWPGHPARSLQTKVTPKSTPSAARVLVLEREMKTRCPQRGLRAGSSLIEVLIAMGVLAVVLPLVFAVLARAGQSCAASQAETRCVAILPFCMNEIEAAQQGNACFLPPLTRGVTIPATGACLALAFTKDGRAIGCVEPKTYLAGVHQLANEPIRFLASFHTEPAPTRPNIPAMLTLRITLEYPAAAPLEVRRHLDFFTCIP